MKWRKRWRRWWRRSFRPRTSPPKVGYDRLKIEVDVAQPLLDYGGPETVEAVMKAVADAAQVVVVRRMENG